MRHLDLALAGPPSPDRHDAVFAGRRHRASTPAWTGSKRTQALTEQNVVFTQNIVEEFPPQPKTFWNDTAWRIQGVEPDQQGEVNLGAIGAENHATWFFNEDTNNGR